MARFGVFESENPQQVDVGSCFDALDPGVSETFVKLLEEVTERLGSCFSCSWKAAKKSVSAVASGDAVLVGAMEQEADAINNSFLYVGCGAVQYFLRSNLVYSSENVSHRCSLWATRAECRRADGVARQVVSALQQIEAGGNTSWTLKGQSTRGTNIQR